MPWCSRQWQGDRKPWWTVTRGHEHGAATHFQVWAAARQLPPGAHEHVHAARHAIAADHPHAPTLTQARPPTFSPGELPASCPQVLMKTYTWRSTPLHLTTPMHPHSRKPARPPSARGSCPPAAARCA